MIFVMSVRNLLRSVIAKWLYRFGGGLKMEKPKMKSMTIDEARLIGKYRKFDITLKYDGTLMFWNGTDLVSDRGIVRTDRFRHIAKMLKEKNIPSCMGEIYVTKEDIGKKRTCVFDISSSENWSKARYCVFSPDNVVELVDELDSDMIHKPISFLDLDRAWEYVLENNEEGLVLKSGKELYKVKAKTEIKEPIVEWESSKDKGTFILKSGNRISGTSMGFVKQYQDIKAKGKVAQAEVEMLFITEGNKYFQPVLREIVET